MPKAYEVIADDLRRSLCEGRRGPGERLPALRDNGRLQWEKNRAREPLRKRAETGATEHDTGLELQDLVFYARYREIQAPKDLADAFGVPEGTALVERTYRTRRAAETAPFSLVTSRVPRDMIAGNPDLLDDSKEPWPGGTQSQLYTVGIELGRVEERFTARPPTPEEAEELELPSGTPVILLRKTSYDIDGRVVDISDVTLPGDRTELLFTTFLERW
ncbi:UTRA domain-containing protein [Streptomyces sp. NPDC002845]